MSDAASPLLTAVLMGTAFGGGFFLLLFVLWSAGRSPLVRTIGDMVAALFYLVMALAQAWNTRETDDAVLWKAVSAVLALVAAFNTFRFSKIYRQKVGASAPDGMAKP
jgi:hypothetical protein